VSQKSADEWSKKIDVVYMKIYCILFLKLYCIFGVNPSIGDKKRMWLIHSSAKSNQSLIRKREMLTCVFRL